MTTPDNGQSRRIACSNSDSRSAGPSGDRSSPTLTRSPRGEGRRRRDGQYVVARGTQTRHLERLRYKPVIAPLRRARRCYRHCSRWDRVSGTARATFTRSTTMRRRHRPSTSARLERSCTALAISEQSNAAFGVRRRLTVLGESQERQGHRHRLIGSDWGSTPSPS